MKTMLEITIALSLEMLLIILPTKISMKPFNLSWKLVVPYMLLEKENTTRIAENLRWTLEGTIMIKGEVPTLKVSFSFLECQSVKINQIFKILISRHSYYDWILLADIQRKSGF